MAVDSSRSDRLVEENFFCKKTRLQRGEHEELVERWMPEKPHKKQQIHRFIKTHSYTHHIQIMPTYQRQSMYGPHCGQDTLRILFFGFKLYVLMSMKYVSLFFRLIQVSCEPFFHLFEKKSQPQMPTSKRKHPTSSASALHMWILPPRCANRQKYLDMVTCCKSRHGEFQHGHLLPAATPWATHCHWRSSGRARPLPVKTVETSKLHFSQPLDLPHLINHNHINGMKKHDEISLKQT